MLLGFNVSSYGHLLTESATIRPCPGSTSWFRHWASPMTSSAGSAKTPWRLRATFWSKGIKRSWPFHPQSLELCLKRGVKDLLPPFEPPNLLRSRSFYTCVDSEQSAACPEADAFVDLVKAREAGLTNVNTAGINLQSCQSADESLGPSQYTPTEGGKTGTDQDGNVNELGDTSEAIQAYQEDNICTKGSSRTEVARPYLKSLGSSRETSEKKGKLLVKSGSMTDIRQRKDLSYYSSSVLNPKASNTCPVCKVFSSPSNTTLNAHIDQCLYAVSNAEPVVETVIVKPKVKQRKMQLMVDIYKTALPYTLDDLDRRNGTNWAIDLSVPAVNKVVCTKNRSPRVVPSEAKDSERDSDVYVDSNGIKIRILSKPIGAPLVLGNDGLKQVEKHQTGKSTLMKKTSLESKSFRNKKFKVHGKKCNRLNHLKSQVELYPDEDIHADTSEEELTMRTQKPTESSSCGRSGTIRQWVCSKRSGITNNLSRKSNNTSSDSMKPGTKKLARSRMIGGFDDPQITESYTEVFSSRSTEETATTLEVNGNDDQEKGSSRLFRSIPRWSSENPSSSSAFPKVPRSAATLAKRKIKEIGRREASRSDKYDTVRNSTSTKCSEPCLSVSIRGLSNDSKRAVSTSKVLRKHRSVSRTRKRDFSPSVSGLVNDFGQEHELDHRHVNNTFSVTNNGTSDKVVKHTQEDTTDNDISYGTDMLALGQGDHQHDVTQQTTSTHMDSEGEEHATQMQCTSVSRNTHEDCCSAISSGSLSLENSKTVPKGSSSMQDQCSTKQSTHTHVSNIVTNNEMEECQVDPASTKESSTCVTNNREMGLATPRDNSSITSNREDSNQDHVFLAFGRDSSDSPISVASTMSSPVALNGSRNEESGPGQSTVNVRTLEKSMSGSSNQETKSMPPAREGEQLAKEKLYCCSCRESISRESHLDHESSTARSDTFARKQVPQLHMGLRTSSSFSTYQRTDTNSNPYLDSHGQLLTGKVFTESSMSSLSYATDCIRPALQTQLPSPPSPMLRLMGKNLMVMNSQESGRPQAPKPDYMVGGNYMPPASFVPPDYQHSHSAFIDRTPSASHQIPLPSVQAGNFVGPPMHGGFMVKSNHHSLQKPYRNPAPVMHHPTYMMKEVIMINDDPPECRSEPQDLR
ncbi:unnamed protein product [Triticum turgidum subsp. durum]|uniref:Uncharacterized protein n=1 Tax=Triticum turgidum subsp. durum TaxID=4567 RepID=A0A9R1PS84_TRITD|nr:unnamed protein product [Triticum turgidum subsp. durum]